MDEQPLFIEVHQASEAVSHLLGRIEKLHSGRIEHSSKQRFEHSSKQRDARPNLSHGGRLEDGFDRSNLVLPPTILIDGRSGSGKTTLANLLGASCGFRVIHADDFYPGWGGLMESVDIVADDVLSQENPGYFRWDWVNNSRSTRVSIDPASPLIVEGVGVFSQRSLAAAHHRSGSAVLGIELIAPEWLRKKKALERDPGFAPWWDMWAKQEDQYKPHRARPDIVVRIIDSGSG